MSKERKHLGQKEKGTFYFFWSPGRALTEETARMVGKSSGRGRLWRNKKFPPFQPSIRRFSGVLCGSETGVPHLMRVNLITVGAGTGEHDEGWKTCSVRQPPIRARHSG